jgi:hypothetical protein
LYNSNRRYICSGIIQAEKELRVVLVRILSGEGEGCLSKRLAGDQPCQRSDVPMQRKLDRIVSQELSIIQQVVLYFFIFEVKKCLIGRLNNPVP